MRRCACWLLTAATPALAGAAARAGATAADGGLPDVTLDIYLLQEKHVPPQKADKPWRNLGGEQDAAAVLDVNVPLSQRLVVRPDDLRQVVLRMKLGGKPQRIEGTRVAFYRMLRPAQGERLKAAEDYAAEPIVSAALPDCIKDGHLTYGGQRLRLWGVCRGAPHNPEQCLRVKNTDFNAIRLSSGSEYSDESAKKGELDAENMDPALVGLERPQYGLRDRPGHAPAQRLHPPRPADEGGAEQGACPRHRRRGALHAPLPGPDDLALRGLRLRPEAMPGAAAGR